MRARREVQRSDRIARVVPVSEIFDEATAERRAGAVAAALASHGVHAGDRVAVIAGNGHAFVAARDAATAAELVLVPINPRLAPAEVAWIVGHANPRVILVDGPSRALAS